MRKRGSAPRTYTLRNAASVVFALTGVIPLLIFVWTLHRLERLRETDALVGLGLALFFVLIGGFIFATLMSKLSEVLRYLEESGEETVEAPTPAPEATQAPGAGPAPAPAASGQPTTAFARPHPAVAPRPGLPQGRIVVPGLGTITAARKAASAARRAAGTFDEIQKNMWQLEAQPHLGARVLVSVRNAPEPIAGSLAQVTEDGLLLEREGERVAIGYLRITNIERDSRPATAQ